MKEKLIYGSLKLVGSLPLPILYGLSDFASFILGRLVHYRKDVIEKNLIKSFPTMSQSDRNKIRRNFYRHLTDVMVETIKLLNIDNKQLAKRVDIIDADLINRSLDNGRPAVIFLGHYGNWEWVQEISRHFNPGTYMGAIYRKLYNPVWNNIFLRLRDRWGNHQIEHDEAFRHLLRLNKEGSLWVIGFIADQRPFSYKFNNWTTFLNQPTAFTAGGEEIGRRAGADFFYLDIEKPRRGRYRMTFKPLTPVDDGEKYPYTRAFYRELESTIKRDPSLWLWSHNRWAFQESNDQDKTSDS